MNVLKGILAGLLLITGGTDACGLHPSPIQMRNGVAVPILKQPTETVDDKEESPIATKSVKTGEDVKWVKIDAAFGYWDDLDDDYVYLLSGQNVQVLKNRVGQYVMDRKNLKVPKKMKVTGAFIRDRKANLTMYYGQNRILTTKGKKPRIFKYGFLRQLSMEGPDAAGRKGDEIFLFKGCNMVQRTYKAKWLKSSQLIVENMPSGLPCDVDAAWPENQDMIILRGNQFWRWGKMGSVYGPYPFSDAYTLTDNWALYPADVPP